MISIILLFHLKIQRDLRNVLRFCFLSINDTNAQTNFTKVFVFNDLRVIVDFDLFFLQLDIVNLSNCLKLAFTRLLISLIL